MGNSLADIYSNPKNAVAHWELELDIARKSLERWQKKAEKVIKRYKDERGASDYGVDVNRTAKFNILWSNIETLKPLLYARTPKPQVDRRFKDSDPIGRAACEYLERCLQFMLSAQPFDQAMRSVRDDYLLAGGGHAWVRYVPQMIQRAPADDQAGGGQAEQISSEEQSIDTMPVAPAQPQQMDEEVVYEEAIVDYVYWKDFFYSPVRTWEDVRWIARRVYMNRDAGVKRFGEKFNDVPLTEEPGGLKKKDIPDGVNGDLFKQAEIFEIWDKTTRHVYWVAKDFEDFLEVLPDPLGLKDFFPCPRPMFASVTTDSMVPIPDYVMYQDQARELDRITERINGLIPMVRVAGCYDGARPELKRIFTEAGDNALVASNDWITMSQGGGIKGFMDLIDFEMASKALAQLYDCRERSKQVLYEVTGLSDLVRGASDPRTTATAEQIKGEFSKARLADRQTEMQRFCRDLISIMAEIICEQFSPETIALMAGVNVISDAEAQQNFMPAIELLKNDALRTFRIEVETDSTIAVNENIEKQSRIEFLSAVSQFMPQALQTFQQIPQLGPAMAEMLLFGVRGFRAGRMLESSIEQGIQEIMQVANEQMQQQAEAKAQAEQAGPPQPPPDPAMVKVQGELQLKQVELDLEKQKNDYMVQLEQLKLQHKREMDLRDSEASYNLQYSQAQGELQLKAEALRNENILATNKALAESQVSLQPKVETAPIPPINISMVMPGGTKRAVMVDPLTGAQRVAEITTVPDA